MALAWREGHRVRINNPVIRAGSVVPASVALPSARFDQPSTLTLLNNVWEIWATMTLSDTPGFGSDFRGQYDVEDEVVLLGGAAASTVTFRMDYVQNATTISSQYQTIQVPAAQTVYQHTFRKLLQPTASLYTVTLRYNTPASDIKLQGQAGAPADWSWIVITKQAGTNT